MTQDEIIEMLRASCDKDRVDPEQNGFWVIVTEELEAFAKLVADKERERYMQLFLDPENQPTQFGTATQEYREQEIQEEREACARLIEEMPCDCCWPESSIPVAEDFAEAIRARGEA